MSEETKPLHIVELSASNVKRLRAVTIRPDGAVVTIAGRNAQGKTSVLDSIEMALGGGKAIPSDPVRHGARKACIKTDLGEIVIERTFSAKGTQLVVRGKDGVPVASPQKLLDSLVSKVSFDPLEFTRMKPADQDALLKQVLGLDFSDLDAARARLYAERTEHNRDAKRLEAQLDAMPDLSGAPKTETSVAALLEEIENRQQAAQENEKQRDALMRARNVLGQMRESLSGMDPEIQKLEERLAELRAERQSAVDAIAVKERTVSDLAATVEALQDPDVSELKQQIQTAEQTNDKVRQRKQRDDLEAQASRAREAADECSAAIQSIDEDKAAKLAAAEFPVEGLGFDDTGPTLNGVPLEQASQAEKLRLSVAIGAALNPRLKVLLVRDGSLLDADGLRLLAEHASATGCQVWLERVSSTGEGCSVLIEDGEIVASEAAESAAE